MKREKDELSKCEVTLFYRDYSMQLFRIDFDKLLSLVMFIVKCYINIKEICNIELQTDNDVIKTNEYQITILMNIVIESLKEGVTNEL